VKSTGATSAPPPGTRPHGATVGHAVLRFLRDGLGCDRLYTVPGEAFLPLLGTAGAEGVHVVTTRHESGAGFAAIADARLTGRPAAVAVNRSPGAANAVIALDAARADPTPILLIVGGADRDTDPRLGFQGTDIEAMLGGLVPVITIRDAAEASRAFERAASVLGAAVPGPVVLVVPEDLWPDEAGDVACPGRPAPDPDPAANTVGDTAASGTAASAAARVRDALSAAAHPVVVAGRLLRGHGTAGPLGGLIGGFATAACVPVLVANKQHDLLDNQHRHYAGHLHLGTHARTRGRLAETDLVVFLGDRPDEVHLSGWYAGQPLMTVHPEPLGPGESVPADPVAVLAALAGTGWPAPSGARQRWARGWRDLETALSEPAGRPRADGVDFADVAVALDRRLPDGAIVTLDAGNFSSWIHRYVRLRDGHRLLALAGGSMGFGVPAAVAAALRHPDRTVVAVVGDGGLLMTGNELATARAAGRCPVVIVADNGGYGTIQVHGARQFPGVDCGTGLTNPDLTQWARSFGIPAECVTRPSEVEEAIGRALTARDGHLLHVRTSTRAAHANFDLPSVQ
jgi:acetolactate synthase-1/2/3 large subunit